MRLYSAVTNGHPKRTGDHNSGATTITVVGLQTPEDFCLAIQAAAHTLPSSEWPQGLQTLDCPKISICSFMTASIQLAHSMRGANSRAPHLRVLDHCKLEGVTDESGIQVGLYGNINSFQHHQINTLCCCNTLW